MIRKVYDFTFADLRDKALAARPDLKTVKLAEKAADADIRLQDAQKVPDANLGAGITQVPCGTSPPHGFAQSMPSVRP